MRLLHEDIQQLILHYKGFEINPIWNNSSREFIVGYQIGVDNKLTEEALRNDLIQWIKVQKLDYNLDPYNENNPTKQIFIFMNNKKKLEANSW